MKYHNLSSAGILGALFLAMGFHSAVAQQTEASGAPMSSRADLAIAPSNAELKKEIESLREQVHLLQQAQKVRPAQKGAVQGKPMGRMGKQGMQKGMDMMNMERRMEPMENKEMDDSMKAPPSDSKPSGGMGNM